MIVSLYACNSVQNKKPHNVLVIHSFNKNDSWVEDLNKGIKEAFDDENLDTQVKEYYLSTELRTEEAKQNEINKLLDSYRSKPLDLIIVADDDCFSSFFATEHPLTHSKPVIFAGIDYVISELIEKTVIKNEDYIIYKTQKNKTDKSNFWKKSRIKSKISYRVFFLF